MLHASRINPNSVGHWSDADLTVLNILNTVLSVKFEVGVSLLLASAGAD